MWCDVLGRGWSWVYQVGGAGSRGDSRGLASQDGVAVLVHVVVEGFLGVGQVSILGIESLVDADGTLVSPFTLVYAVLLVLYVDG